MADSDKKIEVVISGDSKALENSLGKAKSDINSFGAVGRKSAQELEEAMQKAGREVQSASGKAKSGMDKLSLAIKKATSSFTSLSTKAKQNMDELTQSINKAKSSIDDLNASDILGGGAVFCRGDSGGKCSIRAYKYGTAGHEQTADDDRRDGYANAGFNGKCRQCICQRCGAGFF